MMIKSPLGIAFVAAAVLLSVSPEARKAARKLAVRGTELLLDLSDQVKNAAAAIGSQNQSYASETGQGQHNTRLYADSTEAVSGMERLPLENMHNALSDDFMKSQLGTIKM
jgi:hypothetical protein